MLDLNKNNSSLVPKKVSKTEWLVLGIIIISAVLSFVAVRAQAIDDNYLRIYFLNVGQGDAIFVQNYNGNQILIDGGPDNKVLQRLADIMPFTDHSIDLAVLTHPHKDHIVGLIEVLKRYEVGKVLENDYGYKAAEYDEWNKVKTDSKVIQAIAGQVIDLGGGVKIEIIFPGESEAGQKNSNPNNTSIVMRLQYGDESVLFTGDIEATVEKKLTLNGSDIDSDFLKVAHHGSKTSTTENFVDVVSPTAVFIEVGADNRFDHPAQSTIDRLADKSIKYYRTDTNGTVELLLDGRNYSIKPEFQ